MTIPQIEVDLGLPAVERWHLLHPYLGDAHQLLDQYVKDLGGIEQFQDMILAYRNAYIDATYMAELMAIAQMIGVSEEAVLIGNLYYDLIKFVLGCTAFAVDTPQGPLHARNLDWWTENGLLSRATLIVDLKRAAAGPFRLVSWPGFIGAFSGVAPGRFAVTLNAVLSNDPPAFATPVTFLLRSVFETAHTFAEAVDQLASVEIASDCLLLVTGTMSGEMVVIERTPTQVALRYPTDGRLIVTNDYLMLPLNTIMIGTEQILQKTSCGRFERASMLLAQHMPCNVMDCFTILTDPAVRMGITVQQMVMSAAQNILEVRLPTEISARG